METPSDDFDVEQAEIIKIIEGKERRTPESSAGKFVWNKFNGDLVCRVVKEFLRKHLSKQVRVVGPNAYIDGYPAEFDLLLVTGSAIPAAFTNAYRDGDVRFVIEVKRHSYMAPEFPERLLSQFNTLRKQYPNVDCTYLTIRETWNPKKTDPISYVGNLRRVLEPQYRVFCLAESRTQEIVSGQWREFVNHLVSG
ncbi:MAG: hypothetical protein ABSF63_01145 [Candidatus Bathyarchaeia archaeon]